jgi:hypothetical protein
MLGRAKPGQVEVKFESGKKLTRRFENVQQIQQEFWKRWIEEVFPERLKQSKWKHEKRDLKVGYIVLRKDETAAGQTYKYAKVVKVHTSTDGRVRAADIEYKLPGESVFRTTTRPIHKLVLVIPVEEQAPTVGQAKGDEAGPEQGAPLTGEVPAPARAEMAGTAKVTPPETRPEAARQEEAEAEEGGASPRPSPAPLRAERGQQSPPSSLER